VAEEGLLTYVEELDARMMLKYMPEPFKAVSGVQAG